MPFDAFFDGAGLGYPLQLSVGLVTSRGFLKYGRRYKNLVPRPLTRLISQCRSVLLIHRGLRACSVCQNQWMDLSDIFTTESPGGASGLCKAGTPYNS